MFDPDLLDDPVRNAGGSAAGAHNLAEYRAKQKHEKPAFEKADKTIHIGGGKIRCACQSERWQPGDTAGERDDRRGDRAGDQDVDPAHGHPDEQSQSADKSDCR